MIQGIGSTWVVLVNGGLVGVVAVVVVGNCVGEIKEVDEEGWLDGVVEGEGK